MEGNELEIFKINFEASIDAQYQEQIKNLIGQLRQAIFDRDMNVATIAHRDLILERYPVSSRARGN